MLRMKLYQILVNRREGIAFRYHRYHDGKTGIRRVLSWGNLLWLNAAYYLLFFRFLGRRPLSEIYEQKRLLDRISETQQDRCLHPGLTVSDYARELSNYDVISFDIFDTLIFRPLSEPADIFYFVGEKLGFMDFRNVRMWAEADARQKCLQRYGHTEVSLREIWMNLSGDTGLDCERGMLLEQETELGLCYANPFMRELWTRLQKAGKRLIVTSDMYLSKECLTRILHKAGYDGFEELYVSNEYHTNKASGGLFHVIRKQYPGVKLIHIGDNPVSDRKMAEKAGLASKLYPQVNRNMLMYRSYDMSYMVGSAYRGIVSNHLYCGGRPYSMEYEFGYLYGGLFVVGYCVFVHDNKLLQNADQVFFLSRDGDILRRVYRLLYPSETTKYIYWSRKAAAKLMADEDKHDYFRRFLYHKVSQGYSIQDILTSMELHFLAEELDDWSMIWSEWKRKTGVKQLKKQYRVLPRLRREDELTWDNAWLLRIFIEGKWDWVLRTYEIQMQCAKHYFEPLLLNCKRILAVDIGWAGSGALSLSHLVEKVWKLPCEIKGIVAGTNTPANAEPDASEPFLQSGKLVSYLYSQAHNRDLLKKHDPNKDFNVFWELLLSSTTPTFEGFYEDGLHFGKKDANLQGIQEIQRGIMDFAGQYAKTFRDYPYMLRISGRDAYAPMLLAASHKEKYLRSIAAKFDLQVNVN